MTYIVSPKFVYLLGVCGTLHDFVTSVMWACIIFMSAAIIVAGIIYLVNAEYGDDDKAVQAAKQVFKIVRRGIIPLIILVVLAVFIPSKETLIEMQIAKYATFENAESAMTALKNATDYVIDAIKSLE